MKINTGIRNIVLGCCVMGAGLLVDAPLPGGTTAVNEADARIGRPATPGSVAGVARRTTRRTIRRSTIYRTSLPRGCTKVVINGASLWHCGGTYYQPYNNQYVVVYVD
jgi:hypothetical protein